VDCGSEQAWCVAVLSCRAGAADQQQSLRQILPEFSDTVDGKVCNTSMLHSGTWAILRQRCNA
jgi:hypothetical protein